MASIPLAACCLAGAALMQPPRPMIRIRAAALGNRNPAWIPATVAVVAIAAFAFDKAGVVIAAALAAATAVHMVNSRRKDRDAAAGTRAAADYIGHLAESVGAGATFTDAARRAADRLSNDTSSIRRDALNIANASASGSAVPELITPELKRVASLWALSATRGIPVKGLLANARDEIDHAVRHRTATDAALAGPKTTATVLSLLPLAGIAMGSAMGANPIDYLTGSGIGAVLLVVGTALVCAGVLVSHEIIRRAAA
ncbi:hypothetical protein CGLAU_00890 [Corynebacterium glaucum]|uniref:Uncharacterized protein n=1 Tax=Corynebacterium glaucum TaxID=187491 RepID=A0A1Q2HTL4_9CORY|nr:type II secretion system F family protein [Corynebacterium glaucum]AQQ14172.1 hypothetical protein CGLAU_00890 [Corynebacterium glaucum]WJZ06694.1 hypothetical protein CGLAUT_00905 [Corynebacterium glaucum]